MNTQPRRMHVLYIVFTMLRTLKNLVFLLVLIVIRMVSGDAISGYLFGMIGLVLLVLIANGLYQMAVWRRFTYQEEEDRFVIHSGLWQRREKAIYYSRIHSVSIEQPFIQRLLGVVQLKIETPGGRGDGDAVLEVLSSAEAERLQRVLNDRAAFSTSTHAYSSSTERYSSSIPSEQETSSIDVYRESSPRHVQENDGYHSAANHPTDDARAYQAAPILIYRLNGIQLLRAAITELNLGLGLAFIAGIYSLAGTIVPDRLLNHFWEDTVGYTFGIQALLVAVLAGLGCAWVLSLIIFIVKYSGFSVYRVGERLSIRYGLLERRQFVFHPRHVQAVTVKESTLRRWLGFAQVQLHVISSGQNASLPVLHPFIRQNEVQSLLHTTVPGFYYAAPDYRSPERAFWAYVWPGLLTTVFIGAICTFLWAWYGLVALLLILFSVGYSYQRYRYSGAALHGERLLITNRAFAQSTHCIRRQHIEALQLTGSQLQRRNHLLTVQLHIAAGKTVFTATKLADQDAEQFRRWYSRRYE